MFEKVCILGEGAYGTVYKVKSLKTSILRGGDGARVALNKLPKKLKAQLNRKTGVNMANQVERSLVMDRHYVIKEVDTAALPSYAAFEAMQEIELLAELDSHFIVGYHDSFIDETRINIIMEYCQHGDLSTYIKKQNGKQLIDNFIWKVFIHICLGLHYLHSKSAIIHRDIKSLNIFLTKDNSAKIGDLGNCQRLAEEKKEVTNLNANGDQ